MSASQLGEPIVQRSCALCGTVDAGPRNVILLPSGREAFYHLPESPECRVENADPHPEFQETPGCSQLRHALTSDPGSPSPSPQDWLGVTLTDAQQAGVDGTWVEGFEPGTEPSDDHLFGSER